MNRQVIKQRVKGKGMVYSNPCPKSTQEETFMVGNPKCCSKEKCQSFRRCFINGKGEEVVHCEY